LGIQKDAAKMSARLWEFEQKEKEQKKTLEEVQKDKNGKAMRLIKSAFKTNLGSSYFNEYERGKFNSFYIEMSPHISLVDSDDETEINWNADVYFLMGLNQFLSGQSKDAEKYLKKAARQVEGFIKSLPENTDILFPEREQFAAYNGLDGWNKMLHSKCAFYIGLNHYRLGKFLLAISDFEKALQYAPNEIDPQFLLFQSRYWSETFENFPKAMEDMALLSETINADSQKDEKAKKMLLARLYKKIGDFYLPSDIDDRLTTGTPLKKNLKRPLNGTKRQTKSFRK
jgi:tetratricopeptide (TPR) repeat protein